MSKKYFYSFECNTQGSGERTNFQMEKAVGKLQGSRILASRDSEPPEIVLLLKIGFWNIEFLNLKFAIGLWNSCSETDFL